MTFYFHERLAAENAPAGLTVSKRPILPVGDFRITEYVWPEVTLWFVGRDRFTADERQAAYEACLIDIPWYTHPAEQEQHRD